MPVRDEVRDAQRNLARLDAAHVRAVCRLEQAIRKRGEVLAEADRLVATGRQGVERAIADMAAGLGAEVTARLVGRDLAAVRKLARSARASTEGGSGSGGRR